MVIIVMFYSLKMNARKISINATFSKEYYVASDNYLVSIIISNIISNAIKYSNENGEISITLTQNETAVILTISDNGIGIPIEDLDKIMNPFFRSDPTQHPEIKGSGLGLSIVKRLADLLNIQFEIQSVMNKGTDVILIFHSL